MMIGPRTSPPIRFACALAFLAVATMTLGASGCPLFPDADEDDAGDGGQNSGPPAADVDIGGATGATWKLSYADTIQVTLYEGGKAASTKLKASQGGLVSLLGNTVDLTAFCWRTDTVCPSQVLTSKTSVIQPQGSPNHFVIGFNRRGPLAGVNQSGLIGALDYRDLNIPLGGASNGASDPCALVKGSAILATAAPAASVNVDAGVDAGVDSGLEADAGVSDGGNTAERAVTLRGQVTLGFSGSCFSFTTGGAVGPNAVVSLSTTFAGVRLD
jgi:hypothetical protein